MAIGYGVACPKPEPRTRTKNRIKRAKRGDVAAVRAYVFGRERNLCRCCRFRAAESMHELRPRSLGGKVSRQNSVAVCGSGTTGCHGLLQSHQISVQTWMPLGAEDRLVFTPCTDIAATWVHVALGHDLESRPMLQMEAAE